MPVTQQHLDRIVEIGKAFGATRLILFGSALDRPATARDIDIACDGIDGWDLYRFGARLEEELRVRLDLVPLSPATRLSRLIERKGRRLL